jgi:hypothetical protein
LSPGFTSTSMTSTSLKSPISGTRTWLMILPLDFCERQTPRSRSAHFPP